MASAPFPTSACTCTATGTSLNPTISQLCSYEHAVKMLLQLPRLIHVVLKSRQTGSTHGGRQFDISEEINHTKELTLQGLNPGRHRVPSFPQLLHVVSSSRSRSEHVPLTTQCCINAICLITSDSSILGARRGPSTKADHTRCLNSAPELLNLEDKLLATG